MKEEVIRFQTGKIAFASQLFYLKKVPTFIKLFYNCFNDFLKGFLLVIGSLLLQLPIFLHRGSRKGQYLVHPSRASFSALPFGNG